MAKKAKRVAATTAKSQSGVVVPEPVFSEREMNQIVKKCRDIIAAVFGDSRRLGFDSHPSVGNRIIYQLSGTGVTKAEAKYTYNVIPLYTAPAGLYWLAVSLEFMFREGGYALIGISLLVFEGQSFDEKKSALLRAEWANHQEDALSPHAQPHWHIYPSRINRLFSESHPEFEPESPVVDFSPDETTK